MGRRPNPQRKIDLLEEILEYVTAHGLSDLSLRPLAKALGTSTYTLTYQFGSKEEMIIDLMNYAADRHLDEIDRLGPIDSVPDYLDALFLHATDDGGLRWNRLLLEMATMVARDRDAFADYDSRMYQHQLERIEAIMVQTGVDEQLARVCATVMSAAVEGLVVDLVITEDRERVTAAMGALRSYYDSLVNAFEVASA